MPRRLRFGRRALLASAFLTVCSIILYWRIPTRPLSDNVVASSRSQSSHTDHVPSEIESQQRTPSQSPAMAKPVKPSCRVIKVSMLYGEHEVPELGYALASHRRHSERWGCGFEKLEHDLVTRKLYSKHYFLLSVMLQELAKPVDQRRQWLMWVDADSILINPALSPEIFLPPDTDGLRDVYALVTADRNGLNDGIFYLRVHPLTVDLLTQVVAYPLAHPDEDLGWFGEQAAMANTIKALERDPTKPASRIAWLPRMWFNTYQLETGYEGKPGNMLVHFAGLSDTRLSHMVNWLDKLQWDREKWEVPLAQTFYQEAIPKFWAEYAANLTRHR